MNPTEDSKKRYRPSLIYLLQYWPMIITMTFFLWFFAQFNLILQGDPAYTNGTNYMLVFLVILIGPIICAGSLVVGYLNLINTWVELGEEGLIIQRGIIAKKRSLLLYSDIQDIVESQGIFDRIFGLKTLKIVTMSALSTEVGNLSGFGKNTADSIREIVIQRISTTKKAKSQQMATGQISPTSPFEAEEIMQQNIFPLQVGRGVLSASILGFILTILLFFSAIFFKEEISSFGIFLTIPIILFVIWPIIRLVSTTYFLGKSRIEIQYKFIQVHKVSTLYEKIQDVVISSGFFERLLNIASVCIETGAVETYEKGEPERAFMNTIPALLGEHAIQLREQIIRLMGFSTKEITQTLISMLPLEKSKPLKKTVALTSYLAIAYLAICVACYFMVPGWFMHVFIFGLFILILITITKFIYEIYYLKSYYYNFTEDCLVICKGVFNLKEIMIPFERIQNVFVDQDIFDRIFGLWDVHVSTVAQQSLMEGHIDGLNEHNAKALKEMLMNKIKEK